jgi:hypothetical protein
MKIVLKLNFLYNNHNMIGNNFNRDAKLLKIDFEII